jgi:excisionase family DNA binding protein
MQPKELESYLKNKAYAAKFLGVSVAKIDRWVMSGAGPRFVKIGRHVRFRPEDLVDFINKNVHGGRGIQC